MKNRNRLFIVDGNWYLHRSFHTTKTRRPLHEVLPFNLASLICKDAFDLRATHLMVAFDGPKNFRKDLDPEYKANREGNIGNGDEYGDHEEGDQMSDKERIYSCLPAIYELYADIGIPFYQPRKREADDVLCSVSHALHDEVEVINGTQDKDAYQYLLWPSVRLYDSSAKGKDGKRKPQFIDRAKAEKKKKVTVEQMVDYQTLIGDDLDNVKAIKGFSPAKAQKLLAEYGSLRNWLETSEDQQFVKAHKEHMRLNRKLVTLTKDALPPGDWNSEWKIPKTKSKTWTSMSRSCHELHNFMWPKTRGLF